MQKPHFGLTGLAVMGQNLARNIARRGIPIAVHNRTVEKTHEFLKEHGKEGSLVGCDDLASFVSAIDRQRAIMLVVQEGNPIDAVIQGLKPDLIRGDLVIDGGNSHFTNYEERAK